MLKVIIVFTLLLLCSSGYTASLDDAVDAYRREDYQKAVPILEAAANDGNGKARYLMGYLYARGYGRGLNGPAANIEADEWFTKGSTDNYAPMLRWALRARININAAEEKNIRSAIENLADRGDPEAMAALAGFHISQRGNQIRLLENSLAQGNWQVLRSLSNLYDMDDPENKARRQSLAMKGVEAGVPSAMWAMGELSFSHSYKATNEEAIKWYLRAIEVDQMSGTGIFIHKSRLQDRWPKSKVPPSVEVQFCEKARAILAAMEWCSPLEGRWDSIPGSEVARARFTKIKNDLFLETYYADYLASKSPEALKAFAEKYKNNDPEGIANRVAENQRSIQRDLEKRLQAEQERARAAEQVEQEKKMATERTEAQRRAIEAEKARAKRQEIVNKFQKTIAVGENTFCGPVIEIRKPMVKIAITALLPGYPGEAWIQIKDAYPASVASCNNRNGQISPVFSDPN